MQRTPVGTLALACAAVENVVAWSLLAFVAAIANGADGDLARLLLLMPYVLVMLGIVWPVLRRLPQRLNGGVLSTVLTGLLPPPQPNG